MKWLKNRMIKGKVEKMLLMRKEREVVIPKKIKTIGILATSEVEFAAMKAHVRNVWGYQIRLAGYFYSEDRATSIEGFSHHHFNWDGSPSDYFNSFIDEPWDLLLVPSLKLNDYLRYLLLVNKNKLSLGFYSQDTKPFLDLMMAYEGADIHENIQHLISYLDKLKKAC